MRFKTTLILLGIGAVVALFFLFVEQPRHERELERTAHEGRLTDISPHDVYGLTITRPDVVIGVEREEDHWKLTSPTADRADDAAINILIETVCQATVEKQIDVGGSHLSEFGLDVPSATVRLASKSGEDLLEIRIGEFSLTKSHCYAMTRGARNIVLLPAGVRRYALHPLFEYRHKRILDVPVADVVRLEITSKERSMVWDTGTAGEWFTVQSGDSIPGDSVAIEGVVRRLRGLRAKDIPFDGPQNTEKYLASTAGTISLRFKPDLADVTLAFSNAHDGGCYVAMSGSNRVALVDTTILGVFRKTTDDFRDRRLVRVDPDVVVKMTLETPRRKITILKTGAQWAFANPAFGTIDEGAARRLLSRIHSVKFDAGFAEDDPKKEHGFDDPALRLTLFGDDDRVIDELTVGAFAPDGSSRYVSSRSTGFLATIESAAALEIEEGFAGLGAH